MDKKFLLVAVNAKYIHSNPAIYSLKAYAGEELGKYVELAEYTINQQVEEILAGIYQSAPDAIGFSCYIWNWTMIQELLVEIHKLLPKAQLWLGGPEVSYDAEAIMTQFPFLTGVMVGEGEETFRQVLEQFLKEPAKKVGDANRAKESLGSQTGYEGYKKVAGLCLPDGFTPMRELTDLSKIPFLYYDLAPFENKILYYETSRGCPYRCSYCLSSIDKRVRLRNLEIVKKELQFFLDKKVKQVKFVDRTFNCNHDHAMAIWQYLLEHDNGVTNFHFEISADILREDELALLKKFRPGLAQLEIGVQTVNPNTLQAIKRVMNVERLSGIVASIHEGKNIHQHLDLIAGLPYEDYESFQKSFNRVYAMEPEQLQLGFLKVLKGSDMHQKAEEYGICYREKPPYEVMYTKWLSYEEILKLKAVEEMVELYYNSGQFTHIIPYLERLFETPFRLFEALAEFYRKQGYFTNSPARAYRYHVLLHFAGQYDEEHLPLYRELLIYDLYLRENVKSRPDYGRDLSGYKDVMREFYAAEEKEHRYLEHYEGYDGKQLSKMTHLEVFFYPVWEKPGETLPDSAAEPYFVLFDYQKRNPLNFEAYHVVLLQ